jgi:hypothetical protein
VIRATARICAGEAAAQMALSPAERLMLLELLHKVASGRHPSRDVTRGATRNEKWGRLPDFRRAIGV